jgi:hypothetical protein
MVKNLISKMKNRIVKWLLNEKSESNANHAYIVLFLIIVICVVFLYKVYKATGTLGW